MKLEDALQTHFGYSTFREGQKEIISTLLLGRDVLAVLPTGTGKSICYQLPALLSEGITIVVSPLLSLMEDQVQQLRSDGMKRVIALNSFLSRSERKEALSRLAYYKLIYVSPEILQMKEIQTRLTTLPVAYFVIDEAHCISQWGHDFRPDYLRLGEFRKKLGSPPCLAVTATATPLVQKDISEKLYMKQPEKIIHSMDRPMISFHKRTCQTSNEKLEITKELVQSLEGPGLIYFSSRHWAEACMRFLKEQGIERVAYYHGGLESEDRLLIQQQFMNGQIDVICCTSAFGMGLNKKDIRYVLHFHYPVDLESYVQEVGRAARDGRPSVAIVLHCEEDQGLLRRLATGEQLNSNGLRQFLQELSKETDWKEAEGRLASLFGLNDVFFRMIRYQLESLNVVEEFRINPFSIERVWHIIKRNQEQHVQGKLSKLAEMERWVKTEHCRRKALLAYFEEADQKRVDPPCCDNCGAMITTDQQKTCKNPVSLKSWQKTLAEICHQV